MTKTKEYREKLAEEFIKILEEKELDWKKEWNGPGAGVPRNGYSGYQYKGINRFYLNLTALQRGYQDPRWCTYRQVQDKGWKLKNAKGQGVKVEYWFPYDKEEKKSLTWTEFRARGAEFGARYLLRASYKTVFNASLIEGIQEFPKPEMREISPAALIGTLSAEMEVKILNDGGDRAFYRLSDDTIHLPVPECFKSEYAYNSTALHELAHSTGAPGRLDRGLGGGFGTESYAFEELVAEISSCFMSAELPTGQDERHIENHKAYVQSWIRAIREKPDSLIRAVQQAEKAASYMEYKAGLVTKQEYEQTAASVREAEESVILKPSDEGKDTYEAQSVSEAADRKEKEQKMSGKRSADGLSRTLYSLIERSGREGAYTIPAGELPGATLKLLEAECGREKLSGFISFGGPEADVTVREGLFQQYDIRPGGVLRNQDTGKGIRKRQDMGIFCRL